MTKQILCVSAMSLAMMVGLFGCSSPNDPAQRAGSAVTPPPPRAPQSPAPSSDVFAPGVFTVQSPGSYEP